MDLAKSISPSLAKKSVALDKAGSIQDLFEAMKFDTFLSAQEAVEYGLADSVVEKRP